MRRDLPVLVIAETRDYWRKIRDPDGDECWIHRTKLTAAGAVMVMAEVLVLRHRPDYAAPQKARLARGVIARIEKSEDRWLRVRAGAINGWAPQGSFWGYGDGESVAAN